jgi:DNA polymerase I-like protein with 3'-5' exonuclease and polymerase domains
LANKNLISGFGLKLPTKEEVKVKLKKVKEEKKVTKRNTVSSKLSLTEKLQVIREEVNRRLGKFKYNTKVIYTQEELNEYLNQSLKNNIISIDTETNNSIDPITCKIMGLCLYTPGMPQAYVPINHCIPGTEELLYEEVEDMYGEVYKKPKQLTELQLNYFLRDLNLNETKIIMHNAKFDIQVLDFTCMNSCNSITCYWDTMLAAKIIDENHSAKLKDLYQRYIDPEQDSYNIETFFKGVKYSDVDPETFALYAATDAYETYELYQWQVKEFERLNDPNMFNVFKKIEMGVLPCVVEMQEVGLGLDYKYIENLHKTYNAKLDKAKSKIDELLAQYQPAIDKYIIDHPDVKLDNPISITSPKQLAILLYDILRIKPVDPEKPRGTGEPELSKMDHPLAKPLLEFREFSKLVTTYIDKLPNDANPKTKKIHANFNQIGVEDRTVVTGRFSSSDPNLQNIPSHDKKIRPMFIADPGMVIVGGDFSQQEPRILAHFSQDQDLIGTYNAGKDLYATAAARTFNKTYWECMEKWEDGSANPNGKKLRGMMKNILLGIMYGRGPASVAEKTGQTLEEAKKTINDFYEAYPVVKEWMDGSVQMAKEKGYVTTISGRRRRLPNIQLPPYTIKDNRIKTISDESILFEDIQISQTEEDNLMTYYREKLDKTKNRFQIEAIAKEAKTQGIEIEDNTGWIATATRQCVNARIQGSAASVSKLAMIAIYNDKRLRDLGFKTLYVIHDEIAGQCPKENAEEVSQILKEVMIESAKEVCSVTMKVDTYTLKHWYGDDCSDVIKDKYDKLCKEMSPEEAFDIIDKENEEISLKVLREICDGTFDLASEEWAR